MIFTDIEFLCQPVQCKILCQVSFNILNQVLAQALCFVRRVRMFLFIHGAVQMQKQFLDTERNYGSFAEMFGVEFFNQLEDSGLQGIEGNIVIMKNIVPAGLCKLRQISIIGRLSA